MAALSHDACDEDAIVLALEVLGSGFDELEPALRAEAWYRPQGPAIRADLASLQGAPTELARSPDPPPVALSDAATRLGVAYVLVGSRLGARAVARRLEARFGPRFVEGLAYYGAESAFAVPQWRALNERLRDLEREEDADAARARACVAAMRAFDRFTELARAAERD